jgi:sulfur-oxidizing protein SoxY
MPPRLEETWRGLKIAMIKSCRPAFPFSALVALPLLCLPGLPIVSSLAQADEGAKSIENPLSDKGSWPDLSYDIIGDVTPADGTGIIELVAPYRAHEAATVPITLKQPDASAPRITSASLVIDENPAPVAAEFSFGPAMHPLNMELRVRVNQYSNVRIIAETANGPVMSGRFVKASGGCSAPATKDPELALSTMGEIRAKHFDVKADNASQRRDAQIMIRHPNYSGLQRDQITQLFIAAQFIDRIEVRQGDEMLFTIEGGISMSENPVIRFSYLDNGSDSLTIFAEDTEGNSWQKTIAKDAAT